MSELENRSDSELTSGLPAPPHLRQDMPPRPTLREVRTLLTDMRAGRPINRSPEFVKECERIAEDIRDRRRSDAEIKAWASKLAKEMGDIADS